MPIKVLVADDSPTIRRRAASTLSDAGYEVTCLESGEAAWALLESGEACSILLCDVLMPGMDGYELCRRVKSDARLSAIPVLLLRGTFEPWDQAKAETVGADGFITKPFDANVLLSTLGEVVAELGTSADPMDAIGPAAESDSEASASASSSPDPPAAAPPVEVPPPDGPRGLDAGDPVGSPAIAAREASTSPLDDPFALGDEPFAPPPSMADNESPLLAETIAFAAVTSPAPPVATKTPAPASAPAMAATANPATANPATANPATATPGDFDDAFLERLADRVAARLSTRELERVAWEVVPDVAEALIRKRIVEIESKLAEE